MAAGFIIGFLVGIFFSFVLVNYLTKSLEKALSNLSKDKNNLHCGNDDDPANWWKYPKTAEDEED